MSLNLKSYPCVKVPQECVDSGVVCFPMSNSGSVVMISFMECYITRPRCCLAVWHGPLCIPHSHPLPHTPHPPNQGNQHMLPSNWKIHLNSAVKNRKGRAYSQVKLCKEVYQHSYYSVGGSALEWWSLNSVHILFSYISIMKVQKVNSKA